MKEILTAWHWDGSVSEPVPYGEGHINQTYAITVTSEQGAKRYILQKINTNTCISQLHTFFPVTTTSFSFSQS